MRQYLDIVGKVLLDGQWKGNRTGVRTLVVPNVHFSYDFPGTKEDGTVGFPLLTSKKMATKAIAVELEGFIKGITSKKWYQERGCHIWDQWANPEAVDQLIPFEDTGSNPPIQHVDRKELQKGCDDLGPIYGYQWRRFDTPYHLQSNAAKVAEPNMAFDQLATIVHKLKTNPDDRRLVCSAWNPNQLHQMALPPCHLNWVVTHINGQLNLHWTQRSCDLMLGVPFNIASYALLLCLLCKEVDMVPGNLSGMLCDCHIYENQIDAAEKQTWRAPKALPSLQIENFTDIFNWEANTIKFLNYNPHPKIQFELAI